MHRPAVARLSNKEKALARITAARRRLPCSGGGRDEQRHRPQAPDQPVHGLAGSPRRPARGPRDEGPRAQGGARDELHTQPGGKDPVYDLSGQTQSARVTADGGRLQFTLPFEPRALVFEGNKITATAANNANIDTWEKVE